MSLERDCYLLYGFKIESKSDIKVFNDNYEELMEKTPYSKFFNNCNSEQTIVFDCMCGEYVYIGIKLAKLDAEYDGTENVEFSEEDINSLNDKLNEYMKLWPNYLFDLCNGRMPKLYFFINVH